jgi:hypothetical protein
MEFPAQKTCICMFKTTKSQLVGQPGQFREEIKEA